MAFAGAGASPQGIGGLALSARSARVRHRTAAARWPVVVWSVCTRSRGPCNAHRFPLFSQPPPLRSASVPAGAGYSSWPRRLSRPGLAWPGDRAGWRGHGLELKPGQDSGQGGRALARWEHAVTQSMLRVAWVCRCGLR